MKVHKTRPRHDEASTKAWKEDRVGRSRGVASAARKQEGAAFNSDRLECFAWNLGSNIVLRSDTSNTTSTAAYSGCFSQFDQKDSYTKFLLGS